MKQIDAHARRGLYLFDRLGSRRPQLLINLPTFFMKSLKDIHIGKIIKEKVKENSMTVTEFTTKIHHERTTTYEIFKNKSIDIELLIKISEVLHYISYMKFTLTKKQ
jgi:hypothetical protein